MELRRQAYDMVGENEQCHSQNKQEGDLLTKATKKSIKTIMDAALRLHFLIRFA